MRRDESAKLVTECWEGGGKSALGTARCQPDAGGPASCNRAIGPGYRLLLGIWTIRRARGKGEVRGHLRRQRGKVLNNDDAGCGEHEPAQCEFFHGESISPPSAGSPLENRPKKASFANTGARPTESRVPGSR